MKILSELSISFQQNKLYITDVVAKLETTLAMLEELKLQRGGHYRKFMQSYSEKTAVFICGKDKGHQLKLTHAGIMLDQQFDTFLTEVLTYLKSRFRNLQEEPYSLFRAFDPREIPQTLAADGYNEIRSLFQQFGYFLTEKEKESILDPWPMLRTRLSRQRANNPVDVFSNLLASKPDDVKDWNFSAMNQPKRISQGRLVDVMRFRSSDVSTNEYCSGPAISHWILDAKTKRHIVNSYRGPQDPREL